MKIKDVIIKEMGSRGYVPPKNQQGPAPTLDDGGGYDAMGNPTSSMPSASPTNVAAAAPKGGSAGQAKWPTTPAEIKAFQTANKLKADGMIGAKTMAALQKAGATPPPGFKPVGAKQPAKQPTTAPAADPTKDPYDPNKDTNVQMTPQSEIQAASSDAAKKAAISANLPPVATPTPATPPTTGPNVAPTNTAANVPQGGAGPNTSPWGGKVDQGNAMADFQRLAGITPNVSQQGQSAQPSGNKPLPPGLASATTAQGSSAPTGQAAQANPDGTALPPGLAGATTAQGSAEQPAGQAAQPQANPDGTGIGANAQVNPDTGASTVKPEVKSGTGSTWKTGSGGTLRSSSDDEIAWANANPANRFNPNAYPGPGNWDPRTGRSKKEIEQGQKNWNAIKGFFGGNKTAPAQESAELAMLRKLSGLK